jgi:hypothetical protein
MFFFTALSASAGMVQAKVTRQLPCPLDLAQVQVFLDCTTFSMIVVCTPCEYAFLRLSSVPSEATFSIGNPSVITQYSEGFDRLLPLVPITPYYAIFSHRKLVTILDLIDAMTKV